MINTINRNKINNNSKGLSIYAPTLIGSGPGYGYDRLSFAKNTQ